MFIVDFDDTLFNTHDWKQERYKPLGPLGIGAELGQSTYRQIRNMPGVVYTNELHAKLLGKMGFPEKKVLKALESSSTPAILSKFLVPDAAWFLQALKNTGESLVLLTLGDSVFQQIKIDGSGLRKYFDEVFVINKNKASSLGPVLKLCAGPEPLWLINDNIIETNELVAVCPKFKPVLRFRPDFLEADYKASGWPYFQTLREIYDYYIQSGNN